MVEILFSINFVEKFIRLRKHSIRLCKMSICPYQVYPHIPINHVI